MKWFKAQQLNFIVPNLGEQYSRLLYQEFVASLFGRLVLVLTIILLLVTFLTPFFFDLDGLEEGAAVLAPLTEDSFLGTDLQGRQLTELLFHSLHYSLGSALLITLVNLLIAVPFAVWIAFKPNHYREIISGIFEVLLIFPSILLALMLVTIYQNSLKISIIAIIIATFPYSLKTFTVRIITYAQQVQLNRLLLDGLSDFNLVRYKISNVLIPTTISTFRFLLIFSFIDLVLLGLVGIGADSHIPELGMIMNQGWKSQGAANWLLIIPNLIVILVLLLIMIVTNKLEKATAQVFN